MSEGPRRKLNTVAKLERIDTVWNRLQVVAVGKTVQLMSRLGAFSVYRQDRVFTGYSWDCLSAAPGFPASPPERILVLGMGGGTVVRQCRQLYPKAQIDAVEIDARVIRVARQHFHLPRAGCMPSISGANAAGLRRCNGRAGHCVFCFRISQYFDHRRAPLPWWPP